jgi:hypothetical protein
MSDFEERPKFYQSKGKSEKENLHECHSSGNPKANNQRDSKILVDLLRLIPTYLDRNNLRKKKQLTKRRRKGQGM